MGKLEVETQKFQNTHRNSAPKIFAEKLRIAGGIRPGENGHKAPTDGSQLTSVEIEVIEAVEESRDWWREVGRKCEQVVHRWSSLEGGEIQNFQARPKKQP